MYSTIGKSIFGTLESILCREVAYIVSFIQTYLHLRRETVVSFSITLFCGVKSSIHEVLQTFVIKFNQYYS